MTTTTPDLATLLAQLAHALAEQQHRPTAPEQSTRIPPERVLLTPEEAGERLGIGRTTVYALIKAGELDSVQIGRLRRIPVTAIQQYAARLIAQARHIA
jgi:excisionase family DNA binding protein